MTARTASRRGNTSTRRTTYSASRRPGIRRARYSPQRSTSRYIPQPATTSVPRESEPRSGLSAETALPDAPSETSKTGSSSTTAEPRSPETSTIQPPAPEPDTVAAPGTAPATIAAAGNPLAAPPITQHAIAPSSGQVAELQSPRIFNPRISSYALRGTHDSLVRQNERSEEEALERIEDDADLEDRISRGLLVRVPESSALSVNAALPENRRYCRPWTADFLSELSRAHETQFHKPLVVSSAVRTVEYQRRLMRTNHNAADAEGDIVSPHLTGATIDIAKSGLSRREMLWMRNQLLAYQNAGVIDVEEEFHQRCFHITVYKTYGTASTQQTSRPAAKLQPAMVANPSVSSDDTAIPTR